MTTVWGRPTPSLSLPASHHFLPHPLREPYTITDETRRTSLNKNECSWEWKIPYGEVIPAHFMNIQSHMMHRAN